MYQIIIAVGVLLQSGRVVVSKRFPTDDTIAVWLDPAPDCMVRSWALAADLRLKMCYQCSCVLQSLLVVGLYFDADYDVAMWIMHPVQLMLMRTKLAWSHDFSENQEQATFVRGGSLTGILLKNCVPHQGRMCAWLCTMLLTLTWLYSVLLK